MQPTLFSISFPRFSIRIYIITQRVDNTQPAKINKLKKKNCTIHIYAVKKKKRVAKILPAIFRNNDCGVISESLHSAVGIPKYIEEMKKKMEN